MDKNDVAEESLYPKINSLIIDEMLDKIRINKDKKQTENEGNMSLKEKIKRKFHF